MLDVPSMEGLGRGRGCMAFGELWQPVVDDPPIALRTRVSVPCGPCQKWFVDKPGTNANNRRQRLPTTVDGRAAVTAEEPLLPWRRFICLQRLRTAEQVECRRGHRYVGGKRTALRFAALHAMADLNGLKLCLDAEGDPTAQTTACVRHGGCSFAA